MFIGCAKNEKFEKMNSVAINDENSNSPRLCALLVGLQRVNHSNYRQLNGCASDIQKIEKIILSINNDNLDRVEINKLLNENATSTRILNYIDEKAGNMTKDDLFLFYFTGHGDQVIDENGDEDDNKDETLVVFDRAILDDELMWKWKLFKNGVRIMMISDACNSGTNYKMLKKNDSSLFVFDKSEIGGDQVLQAGLIHIGGSRDSNAAEGSSSGGIFTDELNKIFKKGEFKNENYRMNVFMGDIYIRMKSRQMIVINKVGNVTEDYLNCRPFRL